MSELTAEAGAGAAPVEERIVVRQRANWPVRLARWLLGLVIGFFLLAGLIVLGINTDPGRRFVADQIEGLEFANGMKIGVGRIDGSIYGDLTIHGFTLSDPRGVFFAAPLVRLDWRPFDYLDNHLDIRRLTAPTATLARLPEFRATPPSDGPLLPDLDISIGQLKIDRLVVGPSVTGERRVGFVEGRARIADRRAQVALQASVFGGEGRAGGDRLVLALDAVPEDNRLALNAFVSAPTGGVLARMAGVDEAFSARLQGSGDWKQWNGRLLADLDDAPFARLQLTARDGRFGVRGPTRIARLVEGPTAALLGPITTIDLQSSWQNRRADLNGRIGSDAFTLVANGMADVGRNRFDDLRLNFALLKPSVLAPNLTGRELQGVATLNGEMRRPAVDYRLTASTLAFNDMGLQGLVAEGEARFDGPQLLVPIAARARAITGLDTVAGGTLLNVRLDGDLAVDWPRIVSDNIRIRSDRIDARAIILADVGRGLYTGALDGRINNYRVDSLGIFNITTDADVRRLASGGIGLVGRVRAQSTRLFNEGVRDFLGGNLVASSDVAYGADGLIRFSRLRLNAPDLRVTDGRGFYAPDGRVAVTASGVSRQYGPVGVEVTGTASNPRATVTAARPGFGLGIAGLRAEIRSRGNAYDVLARGRSDYGDFTADVSVQTAAGPLTIDIRRATLAGITAQGRVRQTAAGPFAGQLRATGDGIGGLVRLDAVGRYQQAVINLRARNAVLPEPAGIAVGAAIVDARVILYDQPEIVADAQLAQARFGTTDVSAFRAIVNYRGGQGFARGIAEGSSGVPFRLAFNADLQPNLWRAALKGRVNGVDVRTASPARIVPRGGTYELLPTRLQLDQGSARIAGSYGSELRLQSRIDGVDLTVINIFAPDLGLGGRATGSIDFAQRGDALPMLDVSLAVRGLTRTTAAAVSRPIDANVVARLNGGSGSLNAVLRTRGTVVGRVQAAIAPAGGGSWTERVARAPLRGGIRYVGPADALFSLAGLSDQSLSGPLGVAADFSGRVEQPSLQGVVRGRNLTYTNATYGTRLTNLAIQGRFTGERLQVDQLTASAGSGTVRGSGYVSLASASGYPADFDLTLNDARLANSDALRVTATGNVRLVKAANEAPVLRGTVRLPATRYQIVREGAADVPVLTGVRFKPPRGRPRVTGDAPPPSASASFGDVRLDLTIVAPGELFVSGMGLESEWRANLRVTGTSQDPRVAGAVDLVRGTLGFAGRSFALQEGRIRFNGGRTGDATVALSATETIDDVDVTVNVTGAATDPRISFTSSPGLPQDEIVSRILFGNSVGQLSTLQAVQLAASLNTLRGSGGGLNPLGQLRQLAGVDRLRILGPDDTDGRGTALAAGKYIGDDIYLEVITDARGFTATQLEVTLSRSLSILSQAGGSGGTNVNVRYRKNY
ncbi:translocation/assembly module TamB domain-containing protein [Sphingomonas sp. LHG3406-1]|uniref:translocation/assembly module TamB domain-containing protein n=1 Tax=Sphingomonas sp. LHG3406-1 TaxID=2804617 RepID=UPI00263508FA|nr:translocation/assembly module TamB domain-containing protein [Sphingomonas sp. LHG3406-1]